MTATDPAYTPTSTEVATRGALAAVFSGAGLLEVQALNDKLDDRGLTIEPSRERSWFVRFRVLWALLDVYGTADLTHVDAFLLELWRRGYRVAPKTQEAPK